MEQQKNLIIVIVLSVAILFGFQYFLPKIQPQQAETQQSSQPASAPTAPAAPGATATAPAGAAAITPRETALGEAPRVAIDTPRLKGSINLVGGKVDDLTLVNYRETPDPDSPQIVLLAPDGTAHPYTLQFGWVAADPGTKVPDADTRWTSSDGRALSPDHAVELTWNNGAGLTFKRRFAVDGDYMFDVTQQVTNQSGQKLSFYPYAQILREGEVPVSSTYLLHEGPVGIIDGTLKEIKYSALVNAPAVEADTTGGWLGITDKYWLTALIPDQKEPVKTRFAHSLRGKLDLYQVDYRGAEHPLEVGASASDETRFFSGAKEVALLDRYESDLGIPRFDRAIDFGWFYFLTKPIFLTLDYFYKWIGNFGLAIMLLTVIIKLIFFPLANKSYAAMSKMKLLQPEMQKLREKYGDDKAKLNQEMMALYKRVGANPAAGCLPIVIQIPVFFSLYKVLYVTIEMRQAPFYGWIHDLSAPDPTSFANLFGLLHFTPPTILAIGAWPLIMGVTMFLQQKLNPQPPDPVQAKMFMALPFVFTYMLAQFASGLVIYWAWNNLLSIAQQWVIMRRAGVTRGKPGNPNSKPGNTNKKT